MFDDHFPPPDIALIRAALVAGELTPAALIEVFLSRYEALDQSGPELRSVVEVAERVVDGPNESVPGEGPLGGVPLLVKDCFDTTDGMLSTSGSLALSTSGVRAEATAVVRLRSAGALVVGKTNLSEWGNFRSTRSASGWSARGGLTRNPYALDRSPGGSSCGSAVAVAAGLVPASVGTETHGSILCPAAMCGVVGVKPTVGLVSTAGVQPVGHSQDTVGPLAGTVRDAAVVLGVLAGRDSAGPAFAAAITAGVRGLRIGVARTTSWGRSDGIDELAEAALRALSRSGAEIVDGADIATAADIAASWEGDERDVLLTEFKVDLGRYLSERPGGPQSLDEVVTFNREHAEEELRWFGQELFEAAVATEGLGHPEYVSARDRVRRLARDAGIDATLRRHGVQALVAPTMPPAWKTDLTNGDPAGFDSAAAAPAQAGYPSVTVPIGLVEGLPVGLTVMGPAWSEGTLLAVAAAVEAEVGRLPRPNFRAPQAG